MTVLITAAGLLGLVLCGVALYIAWGSCRIERLSPRFSDYDAVVLHTRKPRGGRLSGIGKSLVAEAVFQCRVYQCPLYLGVGETMPGKGWSEAEVYARYATHQFGFSADRIVIGNERTVRDTHSEAQEIFRLCVNRRVKRILVMASKQHLLRVSDCWAWFNRFREPIKITFVGVRVPVWLYFFEAVILLAIKALPPETKRRSLALDTIRRRP